MPSLTDDSLSDDSLLDELLSDDDLLNAMWEAGFGTPGPDGVMNLSLDRNTAVALAKVMRTAEYLIKWLLEGGEEFFPSDEILHRIDKNFMKIFLQAAREEFKKAGISEPTSGRHPFHDRLKELKERVKKMEFSVKDEV